MNNNTTKFYICNPAVDVKSDKSWWSDYKVLWGHTNINKCEGILVHYSDYNKLLTFASLNPIEHNKTYQMDIIRIKSFFSDFWTLSNIAICDDQYCLPK